MLTTKAAALFTGTPGNPIIHAQENIASIVRQGLGVWTIQFAKMPSSVTVVFFDSFSHGIDPTMASVEIKVKE